jgi:hypothetical protein
MALGKILDDDHVRDVRRRLGRTTHAWIPTSKPSRPA